MTDMKVRALTVMCARCEARPGEPCVTVSGAKLGAYVHSARRDPLDDAYGEGYMDGRRDSDPALSRLSQT